MPKRQLYSRDRHVDDEVRRLVKEHDLVTERSGSDHIRLLRRDGTRLCSISFTSNGGRTGRNDLAMLRRALRTKEAA